MESTNTTPNTPVLATDGARISAEQIAEIAGAVAELQAARVAEDEAPVPSVVESTGFIA